MPLTQLAPPYPIFTDKNGDPLDAGYLYFGVVNQNPETNPIQVYYDSAFTQPAAQPLRTSNGYVMRNGSPALIYADSQFSVTVRDKKGALVIYSPVGYGVDPASVSGTVIYDDFTGDGTTTIFTLTASPSTKNATNVYIDGVYQSKDNYNTVGSTLTFTTAPPLNSAIEVVSQESSIIGGASSQQITYNQGGSGAVTRTVQSRLRDFVSVKDFGAVGDGVTDDTVAIQAAAISSSSISVPDGDFVISSEVNMTIPKSVIGNGPLSKIKTTAGFSGIMFRVGAAAGVDPKGWTVSHLDVTNNGSASNVFAIDIALAGEYVSKFTLSDVISNTQVSEYFVKLINSIPNIDGLFTSVFEDNWSLGGYYLENIGDSVIFQRNTTTGAGVGYYVNELGTAANIIIRDGNCTSAGGALNVVKGANVIFDGMQVECPVAFTGSNNAAVSVHRPSGGSVYNTKITNNNINTQGNPLYCVYVGNAFGTTIDGNELYCDPATGAHIYLDTGASGTIIGSNKYYSSVTGAEISPIISNNGVGTVGVWSNASISLAGWTSQGASENPLGFFKDRDGTVHLRGRVAGAAAASGSVLFTLPVGFRPKIKDYQISAFGAVSFVRGEVIFLVASTGNVTILTNNTTNLDLNSVTFSTR